MPALYCWTWDGDAPEERALHFCTLISDGSSHGARAQVAGMPNAWRGKMHRGLTRCLGVLEERIGIVWVALLRCGSCALGGCNG